MNLYAWKRVFDDLTTIVYTTNETPSQGDQLYKSDGTPYADYEAITVSDADIALASTVNEYNTLHGEPYVDPYGDYIYVNGYTVYSFDPFEIGGQDYYIPLYRDASSDIQVETEKPLAKLTIQGKTYYVKDAEARQDILNKQDTLVSGTNIKTINNQSILGSGNIDIQGGGGGGSSSATITYFDSSTWTLDVTNTILSTGLSLGNNVNVFKNGQLLQPGAINDYTISSNNITFTEPLVSTDKIAVVNGNMNPMQSIGYNVFTNISIASNDWEVSSEYPEYGYECSITCNGVTPTMYAQITFAPEEANSGNYASTCDTDTDAVIIYSKVNNAITIPTIMVLGV